MLSIWTSPHGLVIIDESKSTNLSVMPSLAPLQAEILGIVQWHYLFWLDHLEDCGAGPLWLKLAPFQATQF
jgi:hypothetical protein